MLPKLKCLAFTGKAINAIILVDKENLGLYNYFSFFGVRLRDADLFTGIEA